VETEKEDVRVVEIAVRGPSLTSARILFHSHGPDARPPLSVSNGEPKLIWAVPPHSYQPSNPYGAGLERPERLPTDILSTICSAT